MLETAPPPAIESVPTAEPPTVSWLEFVQVLPKPETVALPLENTPMAPFVLETEPPLVMESVPMPDWPTVRSVEFVQVLPEPETIAVPLAPPPM